MQLVDPELRQLLAGEYALGTLHGSARRRFAVHAAHDEELAALAARWQLYFAGLAADVKPVAPGPWVWQALERRLGFGAGAREQPKRELALGFWRSATALAAACAVVLAIFVLQRPPAPAVKYIPVPVAPQPQAPAGQAVSVLLTNAENTTGWLIVQQAPGQALVARAVAPEPLPPGKSYELWLLPPGRDPISMGLAPVEGEVTMTPPPALADLIEPGVALAISLEPAGGSPTGLPTGPVLYQGEVVLM